MCDMEKIILLNFVLFLSYLQGQTSTTFRPATTEDYPASCDVPPQKLRNGIVRFYALENGSHALYQCHTGFVMIGDESLTCLYGQWRGNTPYCDPMYCPYPGEIQKGQILLVGVVGKYEYRPYVKSIGQNERIEFHCKKDYKLNGPSGATCVDGKWSPNKKPVCSANTHTTVIYREKGQRMHDTASCNYPPKSIQNGNCIVSNGQTATCTCDLGYKVDGNDRLLCLKGIWTGAEITCVQVSCLYPGPLYHGRIQLERGIHNKTHINYSVPSDDLHKIAFEEDTTLRFECDEGYTMTGNLFTATCVNTSWVPNGPPTCIKKPFAFTHAGTSASLHQYVCSTRDIPIILVLMNSVIKLRDLLF